jgi:RHS repeat-associated protein
MSLLQWRDYRFGFNGQEKDNEIKGTGNSLDFGARVYDSRLGRFLSVDPLAKDFPSQSSYMSAGNNPIYYIAEEGKKKTIFNAVFYEATGKTVITEVVSSGLFPVPAREYTHAYINDFTKWYDYTIINTATIGKDGKIKSVHTSGPIVNINEQPRINTGVINLEAWAIAKSGDYTNDYKKQGGSFAGLIYQSPEGKGTDWRFSASPAPGTQIINIDDFMATLGVTQSWTNSFPNAQKLDETLDAIDHVQDAIDAGLAIGEVVNELKGKPKPANDSTWCENCGKDISNKDTLGHGLRSGLKPKPKK